MARELKIHMLRPDYDSVTALCGKVTENSTTDPETVSCKSCSGMYRTNMEWYSQVHNRAVEARGQSGEGDLYTRRDLEAGLARLGWSDTMIAEVLNKTSLFRDVFLASEKPDPWQQEFMGVRVSSPNAIRRDRGL
jgi:hypothetical protein